MLHEASRITIPFKGNRKWSYPARSLHWQGNELIDWVGGHVRYSLDKTIYPPLINYAYSFDAVQVSSSAEYVVLYERLGTKGLLLKQGNILREINRSFYHANAYEYPIAFIDLPTGRTGLVHCPDEYCRLEIEDVETGQRLTTRDTKPADFFHSRLSVSPDGRYLLSAGWLWHPLESIQIFNLEEALLTPVVLDHGGVWPARPGVSIPSAIASEDGFVFVTQDDDYEENDLDEDDLPLVPPGKIVRYLFPENQIASCADLQEPAGIIQPFAPGHVISFYQHPAIINVASGQVIARWEDIRTGGQKSSIVTKRDLLSPIAVDLANMRFAVASEDEITVIQMAA
jgi:hypothetical protein